MAKDNELDEILKFIKENNVSSEDDEKNDNQTDELFKIDPPQKNLTSENDNVDLLFFKDDYEDGKVAKEDIDPKKSKKVKKVKLDKKDKKATKNKKEKVSIKDNFKLVVVPKVKSTFKKVFTKQLAIILGCGILVALLTYGGIKIYDYTQVAYLKPYLQKYDVKYPKGILEEFCDPYGKNQNIVGQIKIDDTNTDEYVLKKSINESAYLAKGANINTKQQFVSLTLPKKYGDLENIYSTSKGYLSASQKIQFNTLFDKNTYKVVAAYYTNTDPDVNKGYVFPYNFCGTLTKNSLIKYRDKIKSRSLYYTDNTILDSDYVLSIDQESDLFDSARFVVICVKTKDNEPKNNVATDNEKVNYPQIWFDQHKKENPYRFAGKWYPEIYTDENKEVTSQMSAKDFK